MNDPSQGLTGKTVEEIVREMAAKKKHLLKKKSALWDHFMEMKGNVTKAWCIHCGEIVTRGREGTPRRKCFNYRMQFHLRTEHKAFMQVIRCLNHQVHSS